MSTTLLDYAVKFNQVQGVGSVSLAFLRRLGAIIDKSKSTTGDGSIGAAQGDDLNPATVIFTGDFFLANSSCVMEWDQGAGTIETEISITDSTSIDDFADSLGEAIINDGADATYTVDNGVLSILASSGEVFNITDFTIESEPFPESNIIEVFDPEQLPLFTDQSDDITGAFDGGLNSIYLCFAETKEDIPIILSDQEGVFWTVYGSLDYSENDYITGFSSWSGVAGMTTIDRQFIKDFASTKNTAIFFEKGSSAYSGFYSFANLLASNTWTNQQYIPINPAKSNPIPTTGEADSVFSDRGSFYLQDDELGVRLSFFVAGGVTLTTPYINKEIETVMQNRMLNYLAENQPFNVQTQRSLLEQTGQNVIDQYVDDGLLDGEGVNTVSVTRSNEAFIVNGAMTTTSAAAIWKVIIDALNSTSV